MKLFPLVAFAIALTVSPALAQNVTVKVVASCGSETLPTTSPNAIRMDVTGKLCTAASVSASITGFPTTQSTGTPISVTTGGVTGTLPTGAVVVATNVGTTNAAYCKLGASATTSDQYIAPSGGWFAFTVGASTQLTCLTSTSTTTVNMVGGSGLPTGTGGGSGGGGGGVVTPGSTLTTLSGWTTATAGNATQTLFSTGGWAAAILQLDQTTTLTGGVVTVEGTYDGTNWVTIPVAQVLDPNTLARLTNPYTLVVSTNQPFLILTQGYQAVRIRLSTVITGTATVTPFVTLLPYNPVIGALLNPLAAGSSTIGNVNLTAGELHVGEIGSNQIKVQVAQTVTASSAYSTGNAIGGLMTVAGAARVSGALGASGTGGILTGLQMNSKSLQTTQVDVFLFDANPTGSTCTDKTAFSLVVADFDKVVGILTIPGTAANGAGWFGGGTGSVGIPTYFPVTYDLSSATTIYACAVTRGTPTYTATTDVSFKFNFLRD